MSYVQFSVSVYFTDRSPVELERVLNERLRDIGNLDLETIEVEIEEHSGPHQSDFCGTPEHFADVKSREPRG